MALRGQLLERPVVLPLPPEHGGDCLDGIYLRGDLGALLVVSPLPSEGGSMASPVSNELAYAASRSECASLRLDYRGVGASEGQVQDDLDQLALDLKEGVSFLCETTGRSQIAVASVRSGAWAAITLALQDERVDRLLLVAPDLMNYPEGAPDLAAADVPTFVVAAGEEPRFDAAGVMAIVDAAPKARLEIVATRRHFRSELVRLARLVPPFLGVVDRELESAEERARRKEKLS